jgi:hypothetical protein
LIVRGALAFSTHHVLDWDETYYLSAAVTGTLGRGLYPYISGYGAMPIIGGMGYATYAYAIAIEVFGTTIFALRGVSLAAAVAGVAGIWFLVRIWYGTAAAWIAAAFVVSMRLFMLSNTARMDALAFAWVAWSLAAFACALPRAELRWPHVAAGLLFGLGLQVHIDVIVTGLACGLVYLVRRPRRAFLFAAGAATGVAVYAALNILPDPAAYYATTVVIRADATSWYSGEQRGIFASFLDPRVLLAKEAARYRSLWTLATPLELIVLAAAYVTMLARRTAADVLVMLLAGAVVAGAAVILNNASPLYFIHVLPALVIPIGPLFTHAFSGDAAVGLHQMRRLALGAAAAIVWLSCASGALRTLKTIGEVRALPAGPVALIERVRGTVDRRCRMAGDGTWYVPYFADYLYFVSLRPTETSYGMFYYRTTDEAAYWEQKQPDAVFSAEPLRPAVADYIARHGLVARGDGLWVNPAGCR